MKTHRFFSVFLLLILAVSLLTGPASAAEVPDPAIHAKAALLVDANTGRMVYGKNEHEELYPASLTKIMTALLTLEAVDSGQLSMDQPITVTESALEGLAAALIVWKLTVGRRRYRYGRSVPRRRGGGYRGRRRH